MKPHPQYCFDGKARRGCKSEDSGREEIDVTAYCPETNQVLAKQTLSDKQGERLAVIDIVKTIGTQIPKGFVSGDAGIVSPKITECIINSGHGYVLQIKGNSGLAFEEAQHLAWAKVIVCDEEYSKGHGRQEIRRLKALRIEFTELDEFEKYANIGAIFQVERISTTTKTGKTTHELSYYIGDESFAELALEIQARYIRDHWAHESYHWVKDKVMGEDSSMQRRSNGSRVLSTIRSLVAKLGRRVCNSPSRFIYKFTANPQKFILNY